MTDLIDLTVAELRDGLDKRDFSALELTEAYLKAIDAAKILNAYVLVTPDQARDMARASDERLRTGDGRALEGIPLGLKDLFCTKSVRTQACSHILENFIPCHESTVSANMWRDGAVMLGKLNMDEFGMGSSNENSCYGPAINPHRARGEETVLVPGGSSGGSAAAVAGRLCAAAVATDTGGSIRQPASLTGTVGMKPTYGRCSRWGVIAFASSFDQPGPIARTVRDCAIILRSMAGRDPKDATSIDVPVPDYERYLHADVRGMKIGVPREYRVEPMPEDVDRLWKQGVDWLRDAGAEIVDVSLPHTRYALPAYYILAPAEASSNMARYDGVRYGLRVEGKDLLSMYENTRAAGLGAEVKRRIMIGAYVLSAGYYDDYYLKAQKVRTLIKRDFDEAFRQVDVLLTPSTPHVAFPLQTAKIDPIRMYLNDIFTVPANMAGLPAIAVPGGSDAKGLPLGLQVMGRAFEEDSLFKVADVIERAAGVTPRPEKWW